MEHNLIHVITKCTAEYAVWILLVRIIQAIDDSMGKNECMRINVRAYAEFIVGINMFD